MDVRGVYSGRTTASKRRFPEGGDVRRKYLTVRKLLLGKLISLLRANSTTCFPLRINLRAMQYGGYDWIIETSVM